MIKRSPTAEIVVIGSVAQDLTVTVPHFPVPGETVLADTAEVALGGKGSNQAIRAALSGASVAMIAAVGQDSAGDKAQWTWAQAGIDATAVRVVRDVPTGQALISVSPDGENVIIVIGGANSALAAADAVAANDVLTKCRLVVGQLEIPLEATMEAFRAARASGGATLLNVAPAPGRLDEEVLGLTDILIANELEIRAIAALPNDASLERAAASLVGCGPKAIVITLGAAGAMLLQPGSKPIRVSAPQIRPVDTTGAGDAFVGAFAAAFVQKFPLDHCVVEGVEAGSLACLHRSALPPESLWTAGTSEKRNSPADWATLDAG